MLNITEPVPHSESAGIGRNSVEYLVDAIPESEDLVVIDSGCGTGSGMFNIAE
jgi:hypothetical protein